MRSCQKGLARGVTSVHIVLEVLHRLMMLEAVGKGLVGGNNIAQKLRAHPSCMCSNWTIPAGMP